MKLEDLMAELFTNALEISYSVCVRFVHTGSYIDDNGFPAKRFAMGMARPREAPEEMLEALLKMKESQRLTRQLGNKRVNYTPT